MRNFILSAVTAGCLLTAPVWARPNPGYSEVVRQTAAMVFDGEAQKMAAQLGLQILNVTWEDTGRYKGSSVGPNISDMTLQVQEKDPQSGRYWLTCLPVIRFPNFSDKSADLRPEDFYLLVGNEDGESLHRVSLKTFLEHPRDYMTHPESFKGKAQSLLADRDSHVLVSAQACFLPIPKQGDAQFNPVLFNYQSSRENPAVLTILATREGTSMTIIDNTRDAFDAGPTWGQRLFFNQAGERASLTGKRLSDFHQPTPTGSPTASANGEKGLNMVLLVQVPLKHKEFRGLMPPCPTDCESGGGTLKGACRGGSDVEDAVVGHGEVEGPFTEVDNLAIERDERFPIRVTVQFYKATSNGVVDESDLADIKAQIDKVYANSDYVGSLVTEGETNRPTEYTGDKSEPANWWNAFWQRYQENTGLSMQQARELWERLQLKAR